MKWMLAVVATLALAAPARAGADALHVVDEGPRDGPVMVLVHGTAGSGKWFEPMVPELTRHHHRVVRVDQLGHGRSAKPADGYTIAAQARRIADVLDRLEITRAIIVGHSMGGLVATELAQQSPGLVAAIVLIDTAPSSQTHNGDGLAGIALQNPVVGPALWNLKTRPLVRQNLASAFPDGYSIPDFFVDDVMAMPYNAIAGTARSVTEYLSHRPLPGRLGNVPVLAILGTADKRVRVDAALAEYRSIPQVLIHTLSGTGHTPMVETPTRTADVIVRFADSR